MYDQLRESGPQHPVAPGVWLIIRYAEAVNALLDNRLSNRTDGNPRRDAEQACIGSSGLATTNTDPAIFDDLGSFQPMRNGRRHLAFGLDRQTCIGGTPVRMATEAILSAIWPLVERQKNGNPALL